MSREEEGSEPPQERPKKQKRPKELMIPKGRVPLSDQMHFLRVARRAVSGKRWSQAIKSCLDRIIETGSAQDLLALAKLLPGALAPTKTEATIQSRPALPLQMQGISDKLNELCDQVFGADGKLVNGSATIIPGHRRLELELEREHQAEPFIMPVAPEAVDPDKADAIRKALGKDGA